MLILFAFVTLQPCPATNIRPDTHEKQIYQRALSLAAPSKSLAARVGLLPRGGLRE